MQMKNTLKTSFIVLLILSMTSCYENETVIIDESEESNLRFDDELTTLMKSVTSHDASFDDFIDGSHCFSLKYPYQVVIQEELLDIQSDDDLQNLNNTESEIEIVFPVAINLVNFENHTVFTQTEFETLKQMCEDGLMYEDNINCADFIYPMELAIYNTQTRRFDKVIFNSNKNTFSFLNRLDSNSIFEVVYPANILMFQEEHFSIDNNFSLTTHFKIALSTCGMED